MVCVCVRGGGVVVAGRDGGVRTGEQPSKGIKIVDIFGIGPPPPPAPKHLPVQLK